MTPWSLNVKLGPRRNYHKGRAAIRHYANQTALVGAFSVIVQPVVEPMDRFAALIFSGFSVVSSIKSMCLCTSLPVKPI